MRCAEGESEPRRQNLPRFLRQGRIQANRQSRQPRLFASLSYFIDSSGFVLLDMGASIQTEVTTVWGVDERDS